MEGTDEGSEGALKTEEETYTRSRLVETRGPVSPRCGHLRAILFSQVGETANLVLACYVCAFPHFCLFACL